MSFDSTVLTPRQPVIKSQFTPANPTGTTSTTGVMAGLAILYTPSKSGILRITCEIQLGNTTTADGGTAQISEGTGTVPVNGAAKTGTQLGASKTVTALTGILNSPVTLNALITGLIKGVQIWIDLLLTAVTGGTTTNTSIVIIIEET